MKVEEKLSLSAGRDGGLQSFELAGMLTVKIVDEKYGRIKLQVQVSYCFLLFVFQKYFKTSRLLLQGTEKQGSSASTTSKCGQGNFEN